MEMTSFYPLNYSNIINLSSTVIIRGNIFYLHVIGTRYLTVCLHETQHTQPDNTVIDWIIDWWCILFFILCFVLTTTATVILYLHLILYTWCPFHICMQNILDFYSFSCHWITAMMKHRHRHTCGLPLKTLTPWCWQDILSKQWKHNNIRNNKFFIQIIQKS